MVYQLLDINYAVDPGQQVLPLRVSNSPKIQTDALMSISLSDIQHLRDTKLRLSSRLLSNTTEKIDNSQQEKQTQNISSWKSNG